MIKLRTIPCVCVALMLLAFYASGQSGTTKSVSRNDHIFPASSTAKSSIDFDERGFLIQGKRTFIVSAGMEYARVPRGLWRD
ncbi:MAG TPA: hypothetical protein VFE57_00665, partial [Cyclobacteriaceae bacterium]|nr:hypothetical protein [Cyclobacteriaceae bacterium]